MTIVDVLTGPVAEMKTLALQSPTPAQLRLLPRRNCQSQQEPMTDEAKHPEGTGNLLPPNEASPEADNPQPQKPRSFFGHPAVGMVSTVASLISIGLAVYLYYAENPSITTHLLRTTSDKLASCSL
jgi:hypothetical protein